VYLRIHSATTGGEGGGQGHNGGVWEWTSTVFDKIEGFVPSTLYPGYSADFYDTHHNVVVRGTLSLDHFLPVLTKLARRLVGPTRRFRV
jgi:formylglycine-generating enzyme required for sulfatase activity